MVIQLCLTGAECAPRSFLEMQLRDREPGEGQIPFRAWYITQAWSSLGVKNGDNT